MTHRAATTEQQRTKSSFVSEVVSELKKVVWLSRREVVKLTFLVLVIAVVMGLVLGAFDYAFARILAFFLGG